MGGDRVGHPRSLDSLQSLNEVQYDIMSKESQNNEYNLRHKTLKKVNNRIMKVYFLRINEKCVFKSSCSLKPNGIHWENKDYYC